MALRSIAEVEQWVATNGIEQLRLSIADRRFDPDSERFARDWLSRRDALEERQAREAQEAAQRALNERVAAAAERSAGAAERSAAEARHANRISWLALLVALAALFVAAWQFIMPTS